MVTFTCNACGDSVKKNKVVTHYQSQCRNCTVLSCIDCGKDFHGDEYIQHNSCISEAQKYQGHLYKEKPNQNKGEVKQQAWLEVVRQATSAASPRLQAALAKLEDFDNVPRKQAKFINFARNSLRLYDDKLLQELWTLFDTVKKAAEPQKPEPAPPAAQAEISHEEPAEANAEAPEDGEEASSEKVKKAKKTKHKTEAAEEEKEDEEEASSEKKAKKAKKNKHKAEEETEEEKEEEVAEIKKHKKHKKSKGDDDTEVAIDAPVKRKAELQGEEQSSGKTEKAKKSKRVKASSESEE